MQLSVSLTFTWASHESPLWSDGDTELRRDVESLLSGEAAGTFLEAPVLEDLVTTTSVGLWESQSQPEPHRCQVRARCP